MSYREMAVSLLNQIPDYKMAQVVFFLQGAAIQDGYPNKETIEAMDELDNGGGVLFSGSTEDLFRELGK